MLIKTDLKLTHEWVKVPLRLLADQNLKDSEVRLWIRLAGLIGVRGQFHAENAKSAAESVGLCVDTFRNRRRSLRQKGYLREEAGAVIVTLPDGESQPVLPEPVKEVIVEVEENYSIELCYDPAGFDCAEVTADVPAGGQGFLEF